MADSPRTLSKADATNVLRRVGFSSDQIHALLDPLQDPIDFDRDDAALAKGGVSRETLMDALGGSP